MKKILYHSLYLLLFFTTSCGLQSLNPFYLEGDLVERNDLLGDWVEMEISDSATVETLAQFKMLNEEQKDTLFKETMGAWRWSLIKHDQTDESEYWAIHTNYEEINTFEIHFFVWSNQLYVDAYPGQINIEDDKFKRHLIRVHSLSKVSLDEDFMILEFFSPEYDEENNIIHQSEDKEINLLVDKTVDIQEFVKQKIKEEKAFIGEDIIILKRVD